VLAAWWVLALAVTLAHHVPVGLATGLRAWRESGEAAGAPKGGGSASPSRSKAQGSARAPSPPACRRRPTASPPSTPERVERGAAADPPAEARESGDVWERCADGKLRGAQTAILTSRKRKFQKAGWAPRWLLAFTAANGHLTAVGLNIQVSYYICALAAYNGRQMPGWYDKNQHLQLSLHVSSIILWLWWSLHFFSPWLIMPKEEFPDGKEGERIVAGLIGLGLPAERRLIPLWFLLHLQHTGQFLFIWVSTILDGGSCLVPLWRDVWVSATFAIFYALWGSFRWCVATRPAYPLLEKIGAVSMWLFFPFYGMTTLMTVATALVTRAWEFGIMGKGMCDALPGHGAFPLIE